MRTLRARAAGRRFLQLAVATSAWVAVPGTVAGQDESIDAVSELVGLGEYIQASLADWELPGIAVAVVLGDELVFAEGFGVKELGRADPVDARTLFQIGSTSKAFGAAAIAALVDDGLVTWDDPVVKHLPWFRLKDPWVTRSVTVRDLLAHRSGMPAHAYPALTLQGAREVAEGARLLDNQTPLRQDFRYSNQAYGLAGLIVEAVTRQPWGEWVRERIFEPLGMSDSQGSPYGVWDAPFVAPAFLGTAPAGAVGIGDAPDRNVAMPHGVDREGRRRVLPWQSYDNLQAAGSVASSVTDMANWVRMQLNAGAFHGAPVLSPQVVSEMHAPQISTESTFLFADPGYTWYGMGWTGQRFQGHTMLSHGGGIFGFPAYVAMLPELRAGVVVLANGSIWTPYYPHQEIAAWVFARLFDLEERDWHGEVMSQTGSILDLVDRTFAAQDAARVSGTRPSLPLSGYSGTYSSDVTGPFGVALDGDRMRLQFEGVGAFSGTLEHWHYDVFRLFYDGGDGQAYGSSFVTFTIGPAGRVTRMDLGALGQYVPVSPP